MCVTSQRLCDQNIPVHAYRSYGSFSETGVDIVIILLIYFVLYTNDIMLKRYDNV